MSKLLIILAVLASFLTNLEQKTLQSAFAVTVAEDVSSLMDYPGSLTMHGDCFRLEMFDIQAAYDGKTMYMYSAEIDELTLTTPTEEELLEANPLRYAKALVPLCNVTEKPSRDEKQTLVTLTPKDQSAGVTRFVLRIRNSDLMPLLVEIKEGKKVTTLRFNDPKFVNTKTEYVIKPEPGTYINDMRL